MDDMYLDTHAAEDVFAQTAESSPERSAEFWEAMVVLGGTPEQVAAHLNLSEHEAAQKMAEARGRIAEAGPLSGSAKTGHGGRNSCRSNWGRVSGR